MKVREAVRILRRNGYEKVRHRGSHRQFRKGDERVTVPGANGSKEAPIYIRSLCKKLEGQS